MRHIDLELDVSFERKVLEGAATLTVERSPGNSGSLVLDTRNLSIEKAEVSTGGASFAATGFELGPADPVLGAPLTIPLPANPRLVRIRYATSPNASGLQWLDPPQTAGKQHPFLFTQSQAIHARSWIPLQDTPTVRMTYSARVRTPKNLLAVMGAEGNPTAANSGGYTFRMTQPIPSYLVALAVGDLVFQPLGNRTGVYAERPVIARAAKEFEDTEKMLAVAESLFGPYRWGRYDVLVSPPSLPYGGMENPRLTFASPVLLAGDKSLVSLIAHEMAHSWSGNQVTNATWSDFWLNEGFTSYFARRIVERVYGRRREEMEAALGRQDLNGQLAKLSPRDQVLHLDLTGRDPEAGFTLVPFEKGALFLRSLEESFGRPAFDAFLRGYFDQFAFQSITTAQFLDYLRKSLLDKDRQLAARIPVEQWVSQPGLPNSAPNPVSDAFTRVEVQAAPWLQGKIPASAIEASGWSTQEWLHFLRYLVGVDADKMRELDRAFHLTSSGNAEIVAQWLLMAIRNRYEPAYPQLEQFLTSVGRRSYLEPLYTELMRTPEGRARARAIYQKARPTYHPLAQATVDGIVKK